MDDLDRPQFNVCQYYIDRTYRYVDRGMLLRPATTAFVSAINHKDARRGVVRRVIMTDGGDIIVAEWKYSEGMVFPPKLKGMQLYVPSPQSRPDQTLENIPPRNTRRDSGILPV